MSLERIFNAESVVVVGASRDEKKRGFQAIRTLLEGKYEGDIYPVNPKEDRILGLKCHKSIADIGRPVDLALITTPARTLPSLLAECGQSKIAGAVIIAGGFGELGEEGKKLERQMVEVAREHGVRLVGPNTSGMISVHSNMNLVGLSGIPKGDLALISQSGNMALHLITEAALKSQKGFSYYVGVGNEADIKFHEYLEFFTEDPKTRAIVIYVEGLRDGRKFLQQAYKTTRKKPIVLLKSGRSVTGAQSAGSHTGALAGISEVAHTAFRRAGIINILNSDELFPVAEALSSLPPMKNNSVAILADGGGHATIAADVLNDHGVDIPAVGEATQERLRKLLGPNASLRNPIDVAGATDADPSVFAEAARILLRDESIGGLLMVGLFGGYGIRFAERLKFKEEDAAHQLGKLVLKTQKPIVVHSLYNHARPHSLDLLRYYGIPVYDSLEIACKCSATLSQYGRHRSDWQRKSTFVFNWGHDAKDEGNAMIAQSRKEGRGLLLEHEAKRLLGLHGVKVPDERLAKTAKEAASFAKELGGPVAMKIVSPQIVHKSDARGVRLGVEGQDAVTQAFDDIVAAALGYEPKADIRGVLVSPMAEPGVEVIIGTKIDAQFGPVIMFGIGGIFVEVLKDVVFRVLPITPKAAEMMLDEIRSSKILSGFRGKPPIDRQALIELLLTVSGIIEAYPQIQELDLNPIIVRHDGLSIVDARLLLTK